MTRFERIQTAWWDFVFFVAEHCSTAGIWLCSYANNRNRAITARLQARVARVSPSLRVVK